MKWIYCLLGDKLVGKKKMQEGANIEARFNRHKP